MSLSKDLIFFIDYCKKNDCWLINWLLIPNSNCLHDHQHTNKKRPDALSSRRLCPIFGRVLRRSQRPAKSRSWVLLESFWKPFRCFGWAAILVTHPFLVPRPSGLNFFHFWSFALFVCFFFLLLFIMSGRVACPCSLVVYFPAAVYKSVSTAEVLPKLLDALPVSRDDVLVVQFLRNGAVRVTFKSERACDTVSETGIRYGEYHLRIAPVQPKHVLVYLRDCPIEVPNKVGSKVLEAFGEVHKITASAHEGFPSILNGTRVLKMSLHKDIPSVLRVGGFDCRVWYRRQPVLCSICGKAGHRPKQCPLNGLCRRCKKPGHMARECRNAWGTAESSAASGSSGARAAPPPSAPPSSAPSLAPPVPAAPSDSASSVPAASSDPAPPVPSSSPVPMASVDTALLLCDDLLSEDDMSTDYCPSDESDSFEDAPASPPNLRRLWTLVPPTGAVDLQENSFSSLPSEPAPLIGARCDTRYVYDPGHRTCIGLQLRGPTKHASLLVDALSGRKSRFDAGHLTEQVSQHTASLEEQREHDYSRNEWVRPAIYLPLAPASLPTDVPPEVSWELPPPPPP